MTHSLRLAPIFLALFSCSTIFAQQAPGADSANTDSLPDCALVYPPNTKITLEPAWTSPRNKSYSAAITIVGNLNPQTDSIPEIIIPNNYSTNHIQLFFFRGDGANAAQPDSMDLSGGMFYDVTPAIGDVDGDGIPELVYTAWDRYIRVMRNYTPGANPPMEDWLKSDKQTRTGGFRPVLADMNGDGTPEIIAGDEVFIVDLTHPAGPLLRKVLDANSYYGSDPSAYTPRLNCVATADILTPADCGGDPDCEGLEIAAGPVIYSVDIDTTDGDGFEIKIQRNLNMQTQPDQYSDGYTAVADMNLDGIPDVVVSGVLNPGGANAKMGVYVWNKNGLIKFMLRPGVPDNTNFNYQYNGFPNIANVFDDRKRGLAKDFPEVISSGLGNLVCQNLHGTSFTDYSAWWYIPNVKYADYYVWGNSSSTFDFNGDGYAEVVYSDDKDLRILYGGHLPFPPGVDANRNWATSPGRISGRDTYPVVVDVDNDGQTEIVAVLRDSLILGMDTSGLWLAVFKSGGLPWPPSRTVWNQHNYNVVNVNDDLTIPAQPQKNWLELPASGSGNRPLNMHLGQLPLLGPNQLPVLPLPDLQANVDSVACNQNQLALKIQVCNFGDAKLPTGGFVQFYLGNPATTAAAKYGAPLQIPVQAPAGQCVSWIANLPMPPNGTLWGVVNDNGSKAAPFNLATAFPSTSQLECDYTNNLFSVDISFSIPVLNLGPDRQACSNTATALHAGPGFSKYQWQDGSTDSSFTAQSPGKYWVDAWDVCSNKFTDTVSITAIPTPPIALGADRTLCAGDSLILSLPGFDQIDWASAAGPVCTNCPAITLLPTNDLTLWATGKSGVCTLSDTLNLMVAPLPQLAAQLTPTNCGLDNGAITLQIDQGAAPYAIQWSGGLSGTLVDSLAAGQYLVTVTDMQGCKDFGNYLIAPSDGPDVDIPVLTPVRCFGESNGKIDVTVNGGLMPYQYNWSTGPGNATLENIAAGTYSLTATDAVGCSTTTQFGITEPPALTVQATLDSTDCTSTTGGISVTAQGGTAGYNYLWNGGQTAATLSGLQPGVFTVTLTDANGCSAQQSFNIAPGGSPVLDNPLLTPVRCFGETNGQIEIIAVGDAAPFQYVWPTGPGNETLANLAAGNYTVTVTGSNGCSTTAQFSITEPPALTILSTVDSTDCTSTTGGITVTAQGGTAGYSYIWSGGQTTATLSDLQPGVYTVSLTDANGCNVQQGFNIAPGGSPVLDNPLLTPVRCFGETNGQIEISAVGDAVPFQYVWPTGPGNGTLTNLAAGNYTVTVTGSNGCSTTAQFSITEPPALTVQATVDSTDCNSTTGGISVTAQGGTAGYNYLWSGGQTTATLSGLPPGIYTVTLSDINGCSVQRSFDIAPGGSPVLDNPLLTPVRCFGETNGQIEISAGGDAVPFQYVWPTGPGNGTLANLAAGNYTVTVTGSNGCSTTAQFSITEPPALTVQATVDSTDCTSTTGSITVTAQGGTAGYNYLWSGGQTTATLSGLQSGIYTVTLTDANGCSVEQIFDIAPGGSPLLSDTQLTPVNCFGDSNGQIQVSLSGGAAPYQFNWSTGPGTEILPNLSAGTYTLTATDANGCSFTTQFDLGEPAALTVSAITTPILCAGETGGLQANAQGGTGTYTYLWENGSSDAQRSDLASGNYAVTATDAHGCSAVQHFDLSEPPALSQSATVDSISCNSLGNITLSPQGGTQPYTFSWSDGSAGISNSGLSAGAFTVTTTDVNGCTITQSFVLNSGNAPALTDTLLTPVRCFGESNGEIQLSIDHGMPPYQAGWSNAGTGLTLSGLSAGTYSVTVTDANGCTLSAHFALEQPALVQAGILAIQADTCGRHTGAIDLSAGGGVAPYQFLWSDGQKSEDLMQVAAGIWSLTLTDARGCSAQQNAVVPAVEINPVFDLSGGSITCAVPAVAIAVTPAPDDWTIRWQTPTGGILNGANQMVGTPGDYSVTVTNAAGCSAVQNLNVPANNIIPQALAAADQILIPCGQQSALLDGSASAGGPEIETRWFRLENGQWGWDTLARVVMVYQPGLYLLRVQDKNTGCTGLDSVQVIQAAGIDTVSWMADSVSCFGRQDGSIRVGQVTGGTPPFRYSIDNQIFSANPIFNNLPAGAYPLQVQDAAGCSWQTGITIIEPDSFTVTLTASDTTLNLGQSLRLRATILPPGSPVTDIEWLPADLFGASQELQQRFKPSETAWYEIRVSDAQGCTASANILVRVAQTGVYLPNAIRPEGQAGNTVFTVYAGDDVRQVRLLRLYNRWGELLFERRDFLPNDESLGWDGVYRGQAVEAGVYVYHLVVELADGEEIKLTGDVTVLR